MTTALDIAVQLGWPAATVLIVLMIVTTIIICFLRANRTNEAVNSAVNYERSRNARHLPPPPPSHGDY